LADLKMLDVTRLFECPMILLDVPVLVMELEKGRTINSVPLFVIRWIQGIMAWLVFQPLPKHLDRPESPEVHAQAVFGNRQLLHLEPATWFDGNQTVAFQCKQKSLMMVFNHLEIRGATVPAIAGDPGRLESPSQHFHEHFLKIVVFGLVRGFIVNSVIDRLMATVRIGVIQRHQIDPLHDTMMFSRPEITHEGHQLAVRFI